MSRRNADSQILWEALLWVADAWEIRTSEGDFNEGDLIATYDFYGYKAQVTQNRPRAVYSLHLNLIFPEGEREFSGNFENFTTLRDQVVNMVILDILRRVNNSSYDDNTRLSRFLQHSIGGM